jgi:hypothetical protein
MKLSINFLHFPSCFSKHTNRTRETPYIRSRGYSRVGAEAKLRAGRSRVRISLRARGFSFFPQYFQAGSGAHLVSHSISTGVLSPGLNSRGVILTTHFHPAPKLSKSRATPPLLHTPSRRGQKELHLQDISPTLSLNKVKNFVIRSLGPCASNRFKITWIDARNLESLRFETS